MGAVALIAAPHRPHAQDRADVRLTVGLDIGVSKTVCVIAQDGESPDASAPAGLDLIGAGVIASPAAATGSASDFEACARSIQYAVEEAEKCAGVRVAQAMASYSGPGLCSKIGQGRVKVRSGVISGRDLQAAAQAAAQSVLPADMRALQVTRLGFRVDDGETIGDPRGLEGKRLSAEVCVTMAPAAALEALAACAAQAGVHVTQIVAAPYAAGLAALDPEDRDGALVLDLGAGGVGMAAFGPQGLIFCGVAQGGGARITRALAGTLETSFAAAERAKLAFACEPANDPRETVEAPRLGADGRLEPARVLRRTIQHAVSERLRAQLDQAARMLADAGVTTPAHVVLVGGGAALAPAVSIAQKTLGAPTVVGGVCTVAGLEAALTSAPFATAAGLLRYASERAPQSATSFHSSDTGWRRHGATAGSAFMRAWRWLQDSF